MRYIAYATLIILLSLVTLQAQMAVKDYKQLRQYKNPRTGNGDPVLEAYVLGAGNAIAWTNAYVSVRMKREPFICAPRDFVWSRESFFRLIDEQIERDAKRIGDAKLGDESVESVLLDALLLKFPCGEKN